MPVPWLSTNLLASLAIAYIAMALYFAGRLLWGVWITESMRRRAVAVDLPEDVRRNLQRFERIIAKHIPEGSIEIASSAAISGPAAVGIRRHTLLLPAGFLSHLSRNEVDAVLAHEIAHMERGDYLKNLLFGILSAPIAYHPLVALTRARLAESREMVCDSIAAEAIGGRDTYARSLLRLASLLSNRAMPRVLHAIGIFDANIFERRVMNLTRKSLPLKTARRISIAAACAVLACATCASAIALHMEVNEPSAQNPAPNPKSLNVKVTSLDIVKKVLPVFPPEEKAKAKANKTRIGGSVDLSVVIGKDGMVKDIKVSKSMGENFDKSAMDAVKQWQWKPYLLNGEPVEVETHIEITYTMKP